MEPVTLSDQAGIVLRAHRREDLADVVAMCQDPEMARWTTVPQPYEPAMAEEYALRHVPAGWAGDSSYGWAVEHEGRFAGNLDLRPDGAGEADVGFGLGPWARGRGVLPAALRLAATWAFEELGLQVLHWSAFVGNWASRRAVWKVGFRVEGTVRSMLSARGVRYDAWVGSLLRGDPMAPTHPWIELPVLDGRAVRLRRWRPDDAPRVVVACTDPVTRFWLSGLPDPYDEAAALGYLASCAESHAAGTGAFWCLADPADDTCIGSLAVMGIVRGPGVAHAEVGYWLLPAARGRGVMTEAVRLGAQYALSPATAGGLGLDRLVLRAAVGNPASLAVAVRAGFTRTGVSRGAERLGDGSTCDLVDHDRLATDPAA